MTIIEQLDRLATAAPEVCYFENGVFIIGDYHFWHSEYYDFCAAHKTKQYTHIAGRPALAWLRDALEQVIEARGWEWELGHRIKDGTNHYAGNIWVKLSDIKQSDFYNTPAGALLAALIAAVEGNDAR